MLSVLVSGQRYYFAEESALIPKEYCGVFIFHRILVILVVNELLD